MGMTAYVKQMIKDGLVEGKGVILAVASGGDFPSLSIGERKNTAKTVIEAAEGKVPCFLSVQESHLADTLDLARYAEEIGYYGIQVSVPYYWTTSDGDAINWFKAVHNATKKAIINNTLQPVFNAMLGGTAFISHLASVWPANQLELFDKLEKGDYMGALKIQTAGLTPWYDFRVKAGQWTSSEAPPVKAALVMSGRVNTTGPMRAPSRVLSPELHKELRELLIKIGVPGVKPETVEMV